MNNFWRVLIVVVACFVLCTTSDAAKKKQQSPPRQAVRGAGPTHGPTGKHSKGPIGPKRMQPPVKPGPPIKPGPPGKKKHHRHPSPIIIPAPRLYPVPPPFIVPPYPNNDTSQEDYDQKIEEMRVKASLIRDPYIQYYAFYELAKATGDVKDFEGCYRAASKMKIKDRNEALLQSVELSVLMEELDYAKKAADSIRHPHKKKYAEKLISKANNKIIEDDDDKKSTKVSKKSSSNTTKK